tara:strand:+ start:1195 stop:1485 length:291 start_codon:yes stop_codon:yes gene_type:complete
MPTSENIAIGILLAGYPAIFVLLKAMWDDNKLLRTEAKQALMQGIEIEKSRTAEVSSISEVLSSVQRAIKTIHSLVEDGFTENKKNQSAIYNKVNK